MFRHMRHRRFERVLAILLAVVLLASLWGCGGGARLGDAETDVSATSVDTEQLGLDVLGGMVLKFVGEQIASAVAGTAAQEGLGWLLSLCGVGSEPDLTPEILDRVTQIDAKLATVDKKVDLLSTQLGAVMTAIGMTRDEIIANNETLQLKQAVDTINTNFQYLDYYKASNARTVTTKAKAKRFASDILSSSALDIPQKLDSIHSELVGSTPGVTSGALQAWTGYLISHSTGKSLYQTYLALEQTFGQILTVEAKGLTLTVEALNYRDAAAPKGFPGTAQQFWRDRYTPHIQGQIDQFLVCVERLVASRADIRSRLIAPDSPAPYLPDDAAQVFARADFFAAQCSAKHHYGLNVRVVGDPILVSSYVNNNRLKANTTILTQVNVEAGQRIRQAPIATWPAYYPVPKYMQWSWNQGIPGDTVKTGWITFRPASTIAMAKLELPAAATGDYKLTGGREKAVAGSVRVLDPNMKPVATANATNHRYGSLLLAVRHQPVGDWDGKCVWNYRAVFEEGWTGSGNFSQTTKTCTSQLGLLTGCPADLVGFDGYMSRYLINGAAADAQVSAQGVVRAWLDQEILAGGYGSFRIMQSYAAVVLYNTRGGAKVAQQALDFGHNDYALTVAPQLVPAGTLLTAKTTYLSDYPKGAGGLRVSPRALSAVQNLSFTGKLSTLAMELYYTE